MTSSQITTVLGDSPTRSISLVVDVEADQTAFTPTLEWLLLLTAKRALTDVDSAAVFQLRTGAGITHTGSAAVCKLAPTATLTAVPDNLYYDIRATHQITGETHTVARGRWQLTRPATRLSIPSMPIYTTLPTSGPDLALMTGLGEGVKTAMGKEVGTLGSVQIYGEPMAPSVIILPDVVGVAPPLNAIGMAGGRLVVGDGVRVGGVPVVPTRYAGSAIIDFTGRPKASTWAKIIGIPLTGAEMAIGRKFQISGHITIHGNAFGGGISGRTSIVAGWAGAAGSAGPWNGVETFPNSLENWMPASIVPVFNGNRHDTLVYETGFQHQVTNDPNNTLGSSEYGIRYGTQFFESNNYRGSFGTSPRLPPGVPAELCWMIQINTNQTGNYIGAWLFASWDLNLIFIN